MYEEEKYLRNYTQGASSASWYNSNPKIIGFGIDASLFEIWSILGMTKSIFHEVGL